jgi:hypothetical protein
MDCIRLTGILHEQRVKGQDLIEVKVMKRFQWSKQPFKILSKLLIIIYLGEKRQARERNSSRQFVGHCTNNEQFSTLGNLTLKAGS